MKRSVERREREGERRGERRGEEERRGDKKRREEIRVQTGDPDCRWKGEGPLEGEEGALGA